MQPLPCNSSESLSSPTMILHVLHLPSFCFSKTQCTQNADLSFSNRCSKYSLIHTLNIMVIEILLLLGRAWTPWQITFRQCTFISRTRLNLSSDLFVTCPTMTITLILLVSFFYACFFMLACFREQSLSPHFHFNSCPTFVIIINLLNLKHLEMQFS